MLRNRLLASLDAPDLNRLEPHLSPLALASGEILYDEGEPLDRVYFPIGGVVSFVTVMADGAEVESATVGREGAIGLIGGLGPAVAPRRCIVQVPGEARVVATDLFREAVRENEGVRAMILRYAAAFHSQVLQLVACNARHSVEARFARWLLLCRDRTDSNVFPLTQEFLASMLGVQRTTLTLAARSLQSNGLIRYRRGLIEILDADGLQGAACECYGAIRRSIDAALPPGH